MNARLAALLALERCRRDGAWISAVLDRIVKKEEMDRREAAFASALALGVLQNRSYYDFLISQFCSAKPEKLEQTVLDILRLGVCQITSLDRIPLHAAVHESVALCDVSGVSRAKSLVNAVLRRIAENRQALPEVPGKGSAAFLSIRYSHPLWMAERLIDEKGYEFTEALFSADNSPVLLDLQINTLRISTRDYLLKLENEDVSYEIPPFPEHCVCVSGGNVQTLPGYEEGLFYVQDRAARMSVDIAELKSGMKILDACASPGGKSFAAALNMDGKGEIISCDIREKKLLPIVQTANRLGLDLIRTECRDARCFKPEFENAFDAVIADVPCSGMGVLRKKPEIRDKKEEELRSLPAIQLEILNTLSRYVRPGGLLLYCTCTILREENEDVIREFLSEHSEYAPRDFGVFNSSSLNGCYSFYPNVDRTDGFFVSKLIRMS